MELGSPLISGLECDLPAGLRIIYPGTEVHESCFYNVPLSLNFENSLSWNSGLRILKPQNAERYILDWVWGFIIPCYIFLLLVNWCKMNTERTGQHLWTDNNPQKLILPPHWNCHHTAPGQAPLPSLTGGWDKGGEKWWLALKRNSAKWTKRQSSDIEAHIGGCSTLSWRAHLIQHSFF